MEKSIVTPLFVWCHAHLLVFVGVRLQASRNLKNWYEIQEGDFCIPVVPNFRIQSISGLFSQEKYSQLFHCAQILITKWLLCIVPFSYNSFHSECSKIHNSRQYSDFHSWWKYGSKESLNSLVHAYRFIKTNPSIATTVIIVQWKQYLECMFWCITSQQTNYNN